MRKPLLRNKTNGRPHGGGTYPRTVRPVATKKFFYKPKKNLFKPKKKFFGSKKNPFGL
ncbi:MAG: hypothetical protein J6M53_04220 [Bacteroidaceae bacterium]|nr:hypothetical protein [Bacteroidaceae bacterium]